MSIQNSFISNNSFNQLYHQLQQIDESLKGGVSPIEQVTNISAIAEHLQHFKLNPIQQKNILNTITSIQEQLFSRALDAEVDGISELSAVQDELRLIHVAQEMLGQIKEVFKREEVEKEKANSPQEIFKVLDASIKKLESSTDMEAIEKISQIAKNIVNIKLNTEQINKFKDKLEVALETIQVLATIAEADAKSRMFDSTFPVAAVNITNALKFLDDKQLESQKKEKEQEEDFIPQPPLINLEDQQPLKRQRTGDSASVEGKQAHEKQAIAELPEVLSHKGFHEDELTRQLAKLEAESGIKKDANEKLAIIEDYAAIEFSSYKTNNPEGVLRPFILRTSTKAQFKHTPTRHFYTLTYLGKDNTLHHNRIMHDNILGWHKGVNSPTNFHEQTYNSLEDLIKSFGQITPLPKSHISRYMRLL